MARKNTTTMLATENESWGFWGTMGEHASEAWPLAMSAISSATGRNLESTRRFLDSSHGRHFADEVESMMIRRHTLADAIEEATRKWKRCKLLH